jgi:hypothetical protein
MLWYRGRIGRGIPASGVDPLGWSGPVIATLFTGITARHRGWRSSSPRGCLIEGYCDEGEAWRHSSRDSANGLSPRWSL